MKLEVPTSFLWRHLRSVPPGEVRPPTPPPVWFLKNGIAQFSELRTLNEIVNFKV